MKNTQLVERQETTLIVNETTAIVQMIERAARDPAVDVDKFERLMAMQERVQARQALIDFEGAVASAKSRIGPVKKNATGHNEKRYANFEAYAREIDPILSELGLSYRFRTQQDASKIKVTCVLSHTSGHREENSLESMSDKSGSKNEIQAIGSALTYLQRYSLVQALGLAATDDDDGKKAGEQDLISSEQIAELYELIRKIGKDDAEKTFTNYFKIESVCDLPAKEFKRAVVALEKKAPRA